MTSHWRTHENGKIISVYIEWSYKSWFSCPQTCSHNGFGNTRITDWCYFDIIYSSHSLVLQAEAAFEAGDYSRAASFYAKVVSQHIQLFGLVRIAIASCVLYAQRIAGFWCWIFCTMYPCFSDNTSGDIWGGCIEVCFSGRVGKKLSFFPMCVQSICFLFILAKPLLFVAQLSIDVYQDALRTYLLRKLDYMSKEDRSQITMVSTWAAELYLDKVRFRFLFSLFVIQLNVPAKL